MKNSLDPIAADGAGFSEDRVEVEEGVRLRCYRWTPWSENGASPVFFIAGWISLVTGWKALLQELVRNRPVVYLETREKRSAEILPRLMNPSSFTIPRLADDVVSAAGTLGLDNDRTVLFGSSMGSNAILEALKGSRLPARAAFLVGPNAEFYFPAWGKVAVRVVPAWLIERLKGFVIWYLRKFRVDSNSDPEQMARYVRTVRAADALRLKLSARAVQGYSAMPGLESITTPVAVAYANSDTLHDEREVRRMVDAMPRGTAVSCPSNTYMHDADVARDLEIYLESLTD
ncbi:MAG: alpha/beta hydrolase [Thermoanaerobaculales bacterium]|nr:alpha/beta hydrolase [Thermoanaerobaculales bacterium]